eukprot:COSAG01_NODE_71492_length_255_cov_2.307692_1_plen_77_part_01
MYLQQSTARSVTGLAISSEMHQPTEMRSAALLQSSVFIRREILRSAVFWGSTYAIRGFQQLTFAKRGFQPLSFPYVV